MEAYEKLKLLSTQAHLENAEDFGCPQVATRKQDKITVSDAILPNGKHISLLKTQLSTSCERNCYYCPFRAGRDFQRATFSPDEFARIFMSLYQSRIAEGIFLSSGIVNNGRFTQDKLIATAEILRMKYSYKGYMHLKIMPGAEFDQVERAMQLADRVSINLEAPTAQRLQKLAPGKNFLDELIQPLNWIHQIRSQKLAYKSWKGYWPSSVTQFVVSAAGESDIELLATTEYLYTHLHLKRAYYSSFNPITDTPLENVPPGSPIREQRLYQASFLIRDYGFGMEELPFSSTGNLPLDEDPKYIWAKINLQDDPVEINSAEKHILLRIPGIGLKAADSILAARNKCKLTSSETVSALGVNLKRASPFILVNGHRTYIQTSFL